MYFKAYYEVLLSTFIFLKENVYFYKNGVDFICHCRFVDKKLNK